MNDNNKKLLEKHTDILSVRDLAVKTVATYTSYLTAYLQWVEESLPGRKAESITWEEIRCYIRYLKDVRGLNPRTINVHIAQLRDFYYYVLHKEWDRREVPAMRFDERLPRVPTIEEVGSIISSIENPKHKAEIALLYSSGIRVGELCSLKCGDILKTRGCIHIEKSKNRSERYAVLSDKAYQDLVNYVRTSYKGATRESWLFPGQKPGAHISTESIRRVLKAQLELLGIDNLGYNVHSLRHAFGLHLYDAGVDLISIKEALGHKSLSSTTVYLTLGIGNGRNVRSPYDF